MGALKNLCHNQFEADRYVLDEHPHKKALYISFAKAIAEHLCASDRAKGEQFVIAASLLPLVDEEFDRWTDTSNLDARLFRVEQAVFPGEFNQ